MLKYGRREGRTGCTTLIQRLASLFVRWGINVMRGQPDTELPSAFVPGGFAPGPSSLPFLWRKGSIPAALRAPWLPSITRTTFLFSKHQEVLLCLCSFSVALTALYKSPEPHGHPQPHPKPRAPKPIPCRPPGPGERTRLREAGSSSLRRVPMEINLQEHGDIFRARYFCLMSGLEKSEWLSKK